MKTVAEVFRDYQIGKINRFLELLNGATDDQKSVLGHRHWYMVTDAIEILEKADD